MKRRLLMDTASFSHSHEAVDLIPAVKTAIAFEHAIIPLYLYALYSLDQKRNAAVADLVESIVKDEMLHMISACNLLNALGGRPNLLAPEFFPKYPGPLPGTLADGMIIRLARFSIRQVREVFMRIEKPERGFDFPSETPMAADRPSTPETGITVGEFYRRIAAQLKRGGDALFVGDTNRQVVDDRMPMLKRIVDTQSALAAIDVIVEQGEGTSKGPLDGEGDYAHYYKFQQIAKRRPLRADRTGRHRFSRRRLPYNWRAVQRVPANPHADLYQPGTKARRAFDTFNYTYTCLLRSLNDVVNGRPDGMPAALGLMFSLKHQALEMMSGRSTGGVLTGPSFQYQPVNPSHP